MHELNLALPPVDHCVKVVRCERRCGPVHFHRDRKISSLDVQDTLKYLPFSSAADGTTEPVAVGVVCGTDMKPRRFCHSQGCPPASVTRA